MKGFSNWPHLEQVFKLETQLVYKKSGKIVQTCAYGITRPVEPNASPKQILDYVLNHWAIEGGSHQRRDVTFHGDHCDLRRGHAAHIMSVLNNTVIGIFSLMGLTNAAHARRVFAAIPATSAFRFLSSS